MFLRLIFSILILGSMSFSTPVLGETTYYKAPAASQNIKLNSQASTVKGLNLELPKNIFQKINRSYQSKWNSLTRRQKLIVLNASVVGLVTAFGFESWGYGGDNFTAKSEGGFGDSTKYAGVDKLGHAWSSYVTADYLGYLYEKWGYSKKKAIFYSSISSWAIMLFMEVGDGSSPDHGFAKEDIIANTVGVLLSYYMQTYPALREKFAFRLKYTPKKLSDLAPDDYENQEYRFVIKASGFMKNRDNRPLNQLLQATEAYIGYKATGYNPRSEDRSKNLSAGLSLNLLKLLKLNKEPNSLAKRKASGRLLDFDAILHQANILNEYMVIGSLDLIDFDRDL